MRAAPACNFNRLRPDLLDEELESRQQIGIRRDDDGDIVLSFDKPVPDDVDGEGDVRALLPRTAEAVVERSGSHGHARVGSSPRGELASVRRVRLAILRLARHAAVDPDASESPRSLPLASA